MGKLTRQLRKVMAGTAATPVIVKVKPRTLDELMSRLTLDYKLSGLPIPRFNMFAAMLPNEVIDELEGLDFVEKVYLDREMRIPEVKGLSISFEPIKRLLLKAAEERLRPRKAILHRKAEWLPTSESRRMIEADKAEMEGYRGEGIKVAIVDTDSSYRFTSHVQLRGRVTGKSVIEEASDKNGHGGHVTTTAIGGEFVDRITLLKAQGVAPRATGMGIKVLRGAAGMGSTSDVIKGVEAAVEWGADVINLSLGGPPTEDPEEDPMFPVFEEIKDKTVVCAAIGNEGPDPGTTCAPGSLPNVIGVGAVDANGVVCQFSSRGPTPDGRIKPDVVAPGKNIWSGITVDTYLDYVSDYLGNAFTAISGTSMASPHVTGLMALAAEMFKKELGVKLTTEIALHVIECYGEAKNNDYGHGLIKWSWFRQYVEALKGAREVAEEVAAE